MVGAITTLIVIVAVFLAYNANNGLPFVPTYRISVVLPNAARLGPNNEVRIGGNRVGVVESIDTTTNPTNGGVAAKMNLKLDKSADPVPEDSTVRVRYRSSFGLKYLELERGTGAGLPEGGTLPIEQSSEQTEFDDIGNTFDTPTREASRVNLQTFGSAFAGRGASLNQAIESFNPLFQNLKPVAQILNSPATQLARFFPELGDAARIVAPVAADNAEQFTNMAIAFAAFSSDPEALKEAISSAAPTLKVGIESLPKQRPFLRDFAEVFRLLRPGVHQLRLALPDLNSTLRIGTPVLLRTPPVNLELQGVFGELENLVDDPTTLLSLQRLGDTFTTADQAATKIAPVEINCNYWEYWFTYLTEHITQRDQVGFSQRVALIGVPGLTKPNEFPMNPLDNYAGGQANGRLSQISPSPGEFDARSQPILHGNPYVDYGSKSNPNCQNGQTGYPVGEARVNGQGFDNPTFGVSDIPGSLGIPNLGKSDLFYLKDGTRVFTGQ
jgi:phospholipid/cholesterol/gamma-HCH transport system substrate-binding protein